MTTTPPAPPAPSKGAAASAVGSKAWTRAQKAELKKARQALEIKKLELEVREAEASAEAAELKSESMRYDVEGERRLEKRRAVQRSVDNEYEFHADVNNVTVRDFTDWLTTRALLAPGEPVIVNVNSPGGSVFAGFVMMDSIREARESGVHVTVKVSGMAASMAGIIAQAADKRLIGKDSYLMLHEISTGMFGGYKLSELADEKEFCEKLSRQCNQWYADRSGGKWTAEAITTKIRKLDWWLSAAEALEHGFVDGTY